MIRTNEKSGNRKSLDIEIFDTDGNSVTRQDLVKPVLLKQNKKIHASTGFTKHYP